MLTIQEEVLQRLAWQPGSSLYPTLLAACGGSGRGAGGQAGQLARCCLLAASAFYQGLARRGKLAVQRASGLLAASWVCSLCAESVAKVEAPGGLPSGPDAADSPAKVHSKAGAPGACRWLSMHTAASHAGPAAAAPAVAAAAAGREQGGAEEADGLPVKRARLAPEAEPVGGLAEVGGMPSGSGEQEAPPPQLQLALKASVPSGGDPVAHAMVRPWEGLEPTAWLSLWLSPTLMENIDGVFCAVGLLGAPDAALLPGCRGTVALLHPPLPCRPPTPHPARPQLPARTTAVRAGGAHAGPGQREAGRPSGKLGAGGSRLTAAAVPGGCRPSPLPQCSILFVCGAPDSLRAEAACWPGSAAGCALHSTHNSGASCCAALCRRTRWHGTCCMMPPGSCTAATSTSCCSAASMASARWVPWAHGGREAVYHAYAPLGFLSFPLSSPPPANAWPLLCL